MNILQIEYFLEVCRTLNFTSAANNMHITQPSLSRQIRLLEEEIGAPLLIRNNRSVTLTHTGEVFFQSFAPLMQQLTLAWKEVKQVAVPKREINIGIFQDLKYHVLESFLDRIQKYYDGYQISMAKYNAAELRDRYLDKSLDLVVTYGFVDLKLPNTNSTTVTYIPVAAVTSAELKLEHQHPFDWSQLDGKSLLCLSEKSVPGFQQAYMEIAKKLHIHPTEIVECGDVIGTLFAKENQNAFTFCPMEKTDITERLNLWEIPEKYYRLKITALWNRNNPFGFEKFFREVARNEE